MKENLYLENLYNSSKPLIIYKVKGGYDLFTDFSKKIILTKKNINQFFNKLKYKKKNRFNDLYIGFFGYEILCSLIGVKLSKQKSFSFPKGIFYKPETLVRLRKKISIKSSKKNYKNLFEKKFYNHSKILSPFKVNINLNQYKKIFNKFSKKIREGKTYQIKVCTKYKNKSLIDPVILFWKLMETNSSPESFMIRDKGFSIVSCSPETLIDKKGLIIKTKPIAGTLRKSNSLNKN